MANYKIFYKAFATPPLSAQSLAAGNWTIYIGSQADAGNTFFARFYCYVLRSGSNVATIFAPNEETVSSSTTSYVGRIHIIAGSSATILDGDQIVIEIWSYGIGFEGTYAKIAFDGATEIVDETTNNTTPASKLFTPQVLNLLLTPTGIVPAEAFGTAVITRANIITTAGQIASAEAFGTAVVLEVITISDAGDIASAEAFGTAVIQTACVITTAGQIASAEAFGTAVVLTAKIITTAGQIASAEAFGTAVVLTAKIITTAGQIASAEAFGTAVVLTAKIITTAGQIASAEAFGTADVAPIILITDAGDIASAQAFGIATLRMEISSAGAIASAGAFGTTVVAAERTITTAGHIASVEAFGTASLSVVSIISEAGKIASLQAFGTAALRLEISTAGHIASILAFGTAYVCETNDISNAGDIPTAEAFGTAVVTAPPIGLNPNGIASAQAFGRALLRLNIYGAGAITSTSAFGKPAITIMLWVTAVESTEEWGFTRTDIEVFDHSIVSKERFGLTWVGDKPDRINPTSILSLEDWGHHRVRAQSAIRRLHMRPVPIRVAGSRRKSPQGGSRFVVHFRGIFTRKL